MPETRRIFLSSTREDLEEYRSAVEKALQRFEHLPVGMEAFSAKPQAPVAICKEEVENSDDGRRSRVAACQGRACRAGLSASRHQPGRLTPSLALLP